MRETILEHIEQLEKEKDISILMAVESGSRAWGCPSPDSDYDVRIIFKREKSTYLEIDDKPDSIDYFHGKLLDINGWDIKKTLKLIRKSNATPFEWTQSPIVYREEEGFRAKLLKLCAQYFSPRHSMNHYKGIAKNSYLTNPLDKTIKLKKLFYVLRPLMAAEWIIEKNEIPPMDIPNLMPIVEDQNIVDHIKELLEMKTTVNEDYMHQVDPMLSNFIAQRFEKLNNVKIQDQEQKDSKALNSAFKEIIED